MLAGKTNCETCPWWDGHSGCWLTGGSNYNCPLEGKGKGTNPSDEARKDSEPSGG